MPIKFTTTTEGAKKENKENPKESTEQVKNKNNKCFS